MSTPIQPTSTPPRAAVVNLGQAFKVFLACTALLVSAMVIVQQFRPSRSGRVYNYDFNPATFPFVEHAQSNTPLESCDVGSLEFVNEEGKPVNLKQFRGQKNVVLVVTRGNTSGTGDGAYFKSICLYCATQTSRLIANYQAFHDHEAEVVVVFPIQQLVDQAAMAQFREALRRDGTTTEPPFPLVLDVALRSVNQLGIRADLSKPATYIVDKQGQVRFAYVGTTIADRPSVQSLLEQLAAINAAPK